MTCTIEIAINGEWKEAATFTPYESDLHKGTEGSAIFEYNHDYVFTFFENPKYALAPDIPVNFETHMLNHWPPFLLDILPGGYARRRWLTALNLRNGPESDFSLLLHASGNPPGNIRIKEAAHHLSQPSAHRGFTKEEIARRQESFIEYAEECGVLVSGATSVQGEAPKLLLVKDEDELFYPDGAIPEKEIASHCLVKYPRGSHSDDELVLKSESIYYELAKYAGLFTGELLNFVEEGRGALFIPRFDRVVTKNHTVDRLGMWSLSSAVGSYRFGERRTHEEYCKAILDYSTNPRGDIVEYLKRDMINLLLGNTDNHGRNSAFLRQIDGKLTLSPLYDFAPMFIDPEGIPRATRWQCEQLGRPLIWSQVVETIYELSEENIAEEIRQFIKTVELLPAKMRELSLADKIYSRCSARIDEIGSTTL